MTATERVPGAVARHAVDDVRWIGAADEPIADGALRLDADDGVDWLIAEWRPRRHPAPSTSQCRLHVGRYPPILPTMPTMPAALPTGPRVLGVGTVDGWVDETCGLVTLRGHAGHGALSIVDRCGWIDPRDSLADAAGLLTIATGVLLGAAEQLMIHAGAAVAPDGRAWLVSGDARAGKSTTVLTLARAGWDWMSDDTVALAAGPDGTVMVHAWARTPHVDVGWESGRVTGERGDLAESRVGPGRWMPTAPLGGLLFPFVDAHASTALSPSSAIDTFAALVRQAPWAVVSRHVAGPLTRLAQRTAQHPAFALRLGLDSYNRPDRLVEILAPAVTSPAR